ncbi:dihydroorotate oxidase [Lactobacillus sp. S2-2]|uniref:dihydroorotate oxidase n=1 Tax=Lactobacillus sp. S2-2 TaxID=2692917 RepID=UPI001F00A48C|nr:dihydroorotate oxidase [Lactobacillus sp. S2-2]MCF6514919.1 dihydroorotate oxidase [Lactobacillus sp. S2-2]
MTNISLESRLGNQVFPNLMTNASGVMCISGEELDKMLESNAGGIITKSATTNYRPGNPTPRQQLLELGSINSMGIPNEGLDFYLKFVLDHQNNEKPIILSVSGLSVEENKELFTQIQSSNFNGLIELNLSCPNVVGKPQVGYDFPTIKEELDTVFSVCDKQIGVKLPPYFDFFQFDQVAEILNQFPIAYVNTINSIGNGMAVDLKNESAYIKPKGGFGGIGGEFIKPIALSNVRAFRKRLNPEIQIIGTGGIKNGSDVFEHVLCGADIVQIGTELWREGTGVFDRLADELKIIMEEKGYTKLSDFRGKLKEL